MNTADQCVYTDLFLIACEKAAVIEFPPERGWPRQPYCRRHAIQVLTTHHTPARKDNPHMDDTRPNPTGLLAAIRADAADVLADQYTDETARDLAEGFHRLDTWITQGGHLPLDWIETQPDNHTDDQPDPAQADTDQPTQATPPERGDTR